MEIRCVVNVVVYYLVIPLGPPFFIIFGAGEDGRTTTLAICTYLYDNVATYRLLICVRTPPVVQDDVHIE